MVKLNIGLVGYGHVGSAVTQLLAKRKNFIKNKFKVEFVIKTICDRSIHKKDTRWAPKAKRTQKIDEILNDETIDVLVELMGGNQPACKIIQTALKNGKHIVTANKDLLAKNAQKLWKESNKYQRKIYFESAVGAGIPIIKTITEGVAGNKFDGLYGIINGTCNYILTEMSRNNLTFAEALKQAQEKGYAESNPTLDINGMDSAHKLAILVYLAFGKNVALKDIHVEGITHISHHDIEYAESLNLTIKLLAIAKRRKDAVEVRVHPTLIPQEHPLASVHGIFNAIFLNTDPLGDVLLYGEGAGPMAAASGVVSDLINLASQYNEDSMTLGNLIPENNSLAIRTIDQVDTEFYLRFMVIDKPGVLSQITGILGKYGISIASMSQKIHQRSSVVPVIMLTHHTEEKMLRKALEKIQALSIVKGKPVAIRMEEL